MPGFVGFYQNLLGFVRFCKNSLARICEDFEQLKKKIQKIRSQKISQDLRGFGATQKNDIKNQVSIKIIGFVGFTKFISQDLRGFRATLFSFARL